MITAWEHALTQFHADSDSTKLLQQYGRNLVGQCFNQLPGTLSCQHTQTQSYGGIINRGA